MSEPKPGLTARVLTMLGMTPEPKAEAPPVEAPPADVPPEDDAAKKKNKDKKPDDGMAPGDAPDDGDDMAAQAAEAETAAMVREAAAVATKAANARWQAVLASDEAKGRQALAVHMLGSTDLDAAAVRAALAQAPEAKPNGLATRIEPNPNVTAGGAGNDPGAPSAQAAWDKVIVSTRGSIRK